MSEMQAVAQSYMEQLQTAVKSSQELAQYVDETHAFLEELRTGVNEAIETLMDHAHQAESELVARRETVQQEIDSLASAVISPMNALVEEARDASAEIEAEVTRALDELRTDTEAFDAAAQEQAQAAEAFLGELTNQVQQLQGEMQGRFNEAGDRVREFSTFIETTQSHWQEVVQEAVSQIQTAQSECTTTLDNDFIAHVADTLETFDSALQEIDAQVLRDPIGSLKNEATSAIDEQVEAVFNQALDELTHLIDELVQRIMGSSDRTDAETKILQDLFHSLQEFFGPLMDRVGGVQGLASAAGFGLH